jgi:membrane-bound metal-dependent hydrolase YbcI (DUF457 family)
MFVGHLAVGFVAKRAAPEVSVGTGILASMFPDFLWTIFLIAGIEHVQFKPGMGAANYVASSDIGWSHSLLMNAVWSGLFAAAWFIGRRHARAAWVLFAAGLSHWLLDFIAHRPDMALTPWAHRYFGLGLWTSIPATLIVEGGFWLAAIVLFLRATRPKNRWGIYVFWSVAALLTLAWYSNLTGPPPPGALAAGISALILFSLIVAWGYWMDRLRTAPG